ncbi:Lar family restriction alleviation protein [Bradyrhizobium sp. 23AC]
MPYVQSLRRCPFCGGSEVWINGDIDPKFVVCKECSAFGPNAPTVKQAAERWNKRIPPKAKTALRLSSSQSAAEQPGLERGGRRCRALCQEIISSIARLPRANPPTCLLRAAQSPHTGFSRSDVRSWP